MYPFIVEISASMGLFERPDAGGESFSEIVPPKSAAQGIVESICWIPGVKTELCGVGICSTPVHTGYKFNSMSMERTPELQPTAGQSTPGNALQIRAKALVNPKYILLGYYYNGQGSFSNNAAHQCQEQLARRLRRGVAYHTPVMGWKDFPLNYWGLPKSEISPINLNTFLYSVEYENQEKKYVEDRKVMQGGILQYGETVVKKSSSTLQIEFESEVLNQRLNNFVKKALHR